MRVRLNKILSIFLCVVAIFMFGSVNFTYAADESENIIASGVCGLHADNLKWILYSDDFFLNMKTNKTAKGTEASLYFLDDATIKSQIISSNGEILSEDETFLKSYADAKKLFSDRIKNSFINAFLMFFVVVIGALGGTIGPWLGSIF